MLLNKEWEEQLPGGPPHANIAMIAVMMIATGM